LHHSNYLSSFKPFKYAWPYYFSSLLFAVKNCGLESPKMMWHWHKLPWHYTHRDTKHTSYDPSWGVANYSLLCVFPCNGSHLLLCSLKDQFESYFQQFICCWSNSSSYLATIFQSCPPSSVVSLTITDQSNYYYSK